MACGSIHLLEKKHILAINEDIRLQSLESSHIEYGGYGEFPIRHGKLETLVDNAPLEDVFDTAAFYLKNLILLQAFPDANHRTALYAVELFLFKNGYKLDYDVDESVELQKKMYSLRFKLYKTYEELSYDVVFEKRNKLFGLCLEFVSSHSTKSD